MKLIYSIGVKTLVITSSHQSKTIPKEIDVNIFDNLNNNFKNLIKKNFKIENTLFIS